MCQQQLHYTFEIDHIQPLFANGSNDEGNLQAICAQCHRIKTLEEAQSEQACTYQRCCKCQALYSSYTKHTCHLQPASREKAVAESLTGSLGEVKVEAEPQFIEFDASNVDEWFEQFKFNGSK